MKLIILFGPHAVGKMTVGQALSKITGIPLYHNHESIELALKLLPDDHKVWAALSNELRDVVFKHVSKAHQRGLIFTFMWALDEQTDHAYIEKLEHMFETEGFKIYFVELAADQKVRLTRNHSENRLMHKASKRDLEASDQRFIQLEEKYRLNSYDGEIKKAHYLKIDNTKVSPEEVAEKIKQFFNL
jgi:chloramphenicol 3-O-phosphotransferase